MKTGSLAPMRDLDGPSPATRSRVEREFVLVRRLHGAGPGEQWLAKRGLDQQTAVVRIVPRSALGAEQAAALQRDLLQALQLPPHPNVAPLLSLDDTGDRFVFAAAHIEGDDLESLVEQTGPMPAEAAADCLRQALAGLAHAHQQRLAHGKLTASDLILDNDGVLTIGSLGCAALSAAEDFPEIALRDLRSLGAVCKWLAYGAEPPRSANNGHHGNGASAEELLAEVELPEPLAKLVRRLASAGDPSGFSSAAEAIAFLDDPDSEDAPHKPCSCGERESVCCATAEVAEETRADALANKVDAAPSGQQERRPAKAWLYGSIALTLAMLLALLSYLVWR
jgi:serine/threonine protein kinase